MNRGIRRVLVTGATGFVGTFLCERLNAAGVETRAALRSAGSAASLAPGVHPVLVPTLGPDTCWREALAGVDTVFHLAARVHVMDDPAADPLEEFRRVNVAGTLKLARDAVEAGVRRLVFVSSVKVNGEGSSTPYRGDSPAHPVDPYGISKYEAEEGLRQLAAASGLEVVVVRPVLVYGPGVKANFLNLMKAVRRGLPLPLGCVTNRRSLIYVGNLVDALVLCATHPAAAGRTYLVSDGEDVSTAELVRRTARALGVPARLIPVPVPLMRLLGAVTGKGGAVDRLVGSLQVDSSAIRNELGWHPPFTMDEGLRATAQCFVQQKEGAAPV